MKLSPDDLKSLADVAILAATKAGNLIQQFAQQNLKVEHKRGGDSIASQVVTEVDIKSEAIIIETLQASCEKFDLALLTEETEDDQARLSKDYFWCVDPMDGTLAFTESVAGYSVSIALVEKSGQPLIGVVYDPVGYTLYAAIKGQGVRRNDEPWLLPEQNNNQKELLQIVDRGNHYPKLKQALSSLAIQHGYSGIQTIESNGAVMNACTVLENGKAVYFKLPKQAQGGGSLWDFAATAAIFNELGAVATDVYGSPLDLNRPDSSYMNHRGVFFCTDQSLAIDIQALIKLCEQ